MRGYLKRLLSRAPRPVQDWARFLADLLPPFLKYGRRYRQDLALLKESQWWNEEALVRYQELLLGRMIHHAYQNVPYYREVFDEAGLKPDDVRTVQDLNKVPFLTKEIVRKRKVDLIACPAPALTAELAFTGGSTGAPLDFFLDISARAMERAIELRQLLWLGYEPGDVVAELKAETFANPGKMYRYSPVARHLRLGPAGADDDTLEQTVRLLNKFRPAFITAYPSALCILTRWMERNRKTIPSLKYAVTSSATLYPAMKEKAQQVLQCKVIDHYGQNELVAVASQCAEADGYHIQMEQAVLELVPTRDGEYEIVGTSLHNQCMPFIRYKTEDLAEKGAAPCPCGRKHPVLSEVKGRHGDIIVTPEGNLIPVAAMTYAFFHIESIKEGQVVQETIDTLRIKVVPWEDFTDAAEQLLLHRLKYYLRSHRMRLFVERVDEIPRTIRGKRPFVVSHLNLDDYL